MISLFYKGARGMNTKTGTDKRCTTCVHAILDEYEIGDGLKIKGDPIGCRKSKIGTYQVIAQNNEGCSKHKPLN